MTMRRILIVDDEADVRETIAYCLEAAGYEVLTAANGLEGLGMVRAQAPDLAVLDVMMPGENGYRVAKMIRDDEEKGDSVSRLPIILLTARDLSSDPEREQMFMDFSRADRMMYKPFDIDELVGEIGALLDPPAFLCGTARRETAATALRAAPRIH